MNLYDKVVEYVDYSFGEKKPHFERTVYWIEKFIPNATEAHKIAAYAHDIERAFRDKDKMIPEDYLDPEFLNNHQGKGIEIISNFLESQNAPNDLIEKVRYLINKHEVGGDLEQNALMDADSVSYFETNAQHFVEEKAPNEGYQKIKGKFDFMFNRISTDEHRKSAKENYEKWLKELEKYK